MADFRSKRPDNVPGKFFIDDTCISCAACWQAAPQNIDTHPIETYAFITKQPETREEHEHCLTAKKLCPVGAIGEAPS